MGMVGELVVKGEGLVVAVVVGGGGGAPLFDATAAAAAAAAAAVAASFAFAAAARAAAALGFKKGRVGREEAAAAMTPRGCKDDRMLRLEEEEESMGAWNVEGSGGARVEVATGVKGMSSLGESTPITCCCCCCAVVPPPRTAAMVLGTSPSMAAVKASTQESLGRLGGGSGEDSPSTSPPRES